MSRQISTDIEGCLQDQAYLQSSADNISHQREVLTTAGRALEAEAQRMASQLLAATEESASAVLTQSQPLSSSDVDAFVSLSPLHHQLISCLAADLALSDVLHLASRGLAAGSLPFAEWLRITRTTAREQFLERALMRKVNGLCLSSAGAGSSNTL